MYSFVSALMKAKGKNTRWENVDISQMLIKDIFSQYFDGIITLTNPLLPGNRYLSLKDFKSMSIRVYHAMAFEDWLANIGSLTIPTTTTQKTLDIKTVLYSDANKARYNIQRVHPFAAPEVPYPLGAKTDLMLSKTGVSVTDMYKYLMVSVNGLFHLTDSTIYGLRVKDGGKSADINLNNNVGLLSFREIGELSFVPLQSSMMLSPNALIQNKQNVWLDTGVDLTDKTAIMVLGGYLHALDGSYDIINPQEGIVQINIDKIKFAHRYYESNKIIDLSSLELLPASINENLIAVSDLFSNGTIQKFIDLSQTFMVVVDKPTLYSVTRGVGSTGIPGVLTSGIEPVFPLKDRFGKCPEFWYSKEDDQWVLKVHDGLSPNMIIDTTEWQNSVAIDDTLLAQQPYDLANIHFLEIGSESLL